MGASEEEDLEDLREVPVSGEDVVGGGSGALGLFWGGDGQLTIGIGALGGGFAGRVTTGCGTAAIGGCCCCCCCIPACCTDGVAIFSA